MTTPANRKRVLRRFEESPANVRGFFEHVPALLSDFPLDVTLSYMFSRVELAHNMALYCGVVKLHKANKDVARAAVNTHHLTRIGFRDRFETVFGEPLPDAVLEPLEAAERIRDRVMHGKDALERDKRAAIANLLLYAASLNDFVGDLAGFRPFGDLRGFKGRGRSLPKATTRWVLKGMGFEIS